MSRFRRTASFTSFFIMAMSGFAVSWEFRNQYSHASPPAIFIVCALSSFLAGYLGWKFSKIYAICPRAAHLIFPGAVVTLTSAVASILYLLVEPLFIDLEYWRVVFDHVRMVPGNMIWYMGLSVVVWFPAFLIATFILGKLSKSEQYV